jgi:hypothetical protein
VAACRESYYTYCYNRGNQNTSRAEIPIWCPLVLLAKQDIELGGEECNVMEGGLLGTCCGGGGGGGVLFGGGGGFV